jgi:putative sterol carrier protein
MHNGLTGQEVWMRLSFLLFVLYHVMWVSSKINKKFMKFIAKAKVRLMIRTEDGKHGRLFVFDRGRMSTAKGTDHPFDAALVWKDPASAFSVMLKNSQEAVFNAAASGKLRIEGMNVFALWFDQAARIIL